MQQTPTIKVTEMTSESDARFQLEGYSRPLCAMITKGATEIASIQDSERSLKDALQVIQLSVHEKMANVLRKKDPDTLTAAEKEALRHIEKFELENFGEETWVISGEFNERSASFLFKIEELLGKGGINEVYRATELSTGRRVTCREVFNTAYRDSFYGLEAKFLAEKAQKIMRTMPPHENNVPFWFQGKNIKGKECTVFDYSPGENMEDYLANIETLTMKDFLKMAEGAAQGILNLHRRGLVHDDVKPGNFIVNTNEEAQDTEKWLLTRLIDMDITLRWEDYIELALEEDKCVGSLAYVAPEQFYCYPFPRYPETQRAMAEAGDVYALGISFYQMLTGKYPPEIDEAEHPREIINVKFLEMHFPAIPEHVDWLRKLIQEMCSPNWEKRPSMEKVVKLLQRKAGNITDNVVMERAECPVQGSSKMKTVIKMDTCPLEQTYVGRYVVIDEEFAEKEVETGETVMLAKLFEEELGNEKIGIPYTFNNIDDAKRFFSQKRDFFQRLNEVRAANQELFPGSFDLFLKEEGPEGPFVVWVIRGLVHDQISLGDYLEEHGEELSFDDQWEVLIRISRSLAALEKAGYRHPDVSEENIYLAPPRYTRDNSGKTIISPVTLTRRSNIDIKPGKFLVSPEREFCFPKDHIYYRLELMDTSMAQEIDKCEKECDSNLFKFISIVVHILTCTSNPIFDSGSDIHEACTNFIWQLQNRAETWEERVKLLEEIKEKCRVMPGE